MKFARILMIFLFSFACSNTLFAKEVQNVEVINTPDVNVVNTPTVNVGNTVTIDNTDVPVTILNDSANPVPVDVQGEVTTTQRVPITVSGDWDGGGLTIFTPMIIQDIFFYGENVIGNNECGIHFHDSDGRLFYAAVLGLWESVEFHFEAGISSSDISFGSSTDCSQTNYMMMGYSIE